MDEKSADFVLFIDEAGDPGLRAIAPFDDGGASEWFLLGGVILSCEREPQTVDWVRNIRTDINARQGTSLHFRKLSQTKRVRACEMVSALPLKAFVIASHKLNMRDHQNPRAARMANPDWFYNWCLRLLLERVTALVARTCERRGIPLRPIRIVMAERGGHSYSQTSVYVRHMQQQARHRTAVLTKREIVPNAVDWNLVERIHAHSSAGAQLADIVVSAFFASLVRPVAYENGEPARRLRAVMAKENGCVSDFGLVLQPPPLTAEIEASFKDIFRHYGHVL